MITIFGVLCSLDLSYQPFLAVLPKAVLKWECIWPNIPWCGHLKLIFDKSIAGMLDVSWESDLDVVTHPVSVLGDRSLGYKDGVSLLVLTKNLKVV